jgi:hypothetical protein
MSAHDSGGAAGSSHDDLRGEPQTPGWLTLLGVALFFLVMLLFLATRPDRQTAEELTGEAAPAAPSAGAP